MDELRIPAEYRDHLEGAGRRYLEADRHDPIAMRRKATVESLSYLFRLLTEAGLSSDARAPLRHVLLAFGDVEQGHQPDLFRKVKRPGHRLPIAAESIRTRASAVITALTDERYSLSVDDALRRVARALHNAGFATVHRRRDSKAGDDSLPGASALKKWRLATIGGAKSSDVTAEYEEHLAEIRSRPHLSADQIITALIELARRW